MDLVFLRSVRVTPTLISPNPRPANTTRFSYYLSSCTSVRLWKKSSGTCQEKTNTERHRAMPSTSQTSRCIRYSCHFPHTCWLIVHCSDPPLGWLVRGRDSRQVRPVGGKGTAPDASHHRGPSRKRELYGECKGCSMLPKDSECMTVCIPSLEGG